MDFSGRSFKAQMKQANKLNAKYVIIVGEDEVAQNVVTLKNMANSQQEVVAVENIIDKLKAEVKG
jgi:histidyl-tRNA synthetase